jgi:hypothetical protein
MAADAPIPATPSLDVVIISWQGQHENAAHIARVLDAQPGLRVAVIYSNAAETPESGAGEWIQVPNSHFFGWKFRRALECVRSDSAAMVLIQADARAADWPGLLSRCAARLRDVPQLGLWTPHIAYTPWIPQRVDIAPVAGTDLMQVARTDGIVLALARPVLDRLRQLDYDANNLGWGIDCIAIAYCFAHGLLVVRDDGHHVDHPRSRGYDERVALAQWRHFLLQMTEPERCIDAFVRRFTEEPSLGQRFKTLRRGLKARLRGALQAA